MKKIQTFLILIFMFAGLTLVHAQTVAAIEKANKSGKAVFLVVYNANGPDVDKAVSIANGAKKNMGATTVVKMNTTEVANSDLVTKYRLTGVPLPLILVLDKNGNPTGGLQISDATPEKLVDLIPSPKTSEIINALAGGKPVFLVVYKESMTSKKNIINNCYLACNKMDNKSVIVKVDLDDKKETKLIQNLKCDVNAKEPVTYVINKAGQVTGTYPGLTDVNNLVGSATKVASGGCCPGGSKTGGCK
jgi:hypothetical protein